MIEWFRSGGVMMWPILMVGIGITWIGIRTAFGLLRRVPSAVGSEEEPGERGMQAILFWGLMAAVLGFLGTTVGIVTMARFVAGAGEVHPPLVWGGLGVALITLAFGLSIFLFSAVLWFVLHQWRFRPVM